MNGNMSIEQPSGKSDVRSGVLKRALQVVVQLLVIAAILFILSGRLDWVWAWVYLGVGVCILVINFFILSPELIAERGKIRNGVKSWDRWLSLIIAITSFGVYIMAALDVRFGWSPQLPLALHLTALALFLLGQGLFSWAMASNKFFSGAVRIQIERGHTVANGGPYRYVRHPGYVGMIITLLAISLLLGSLWALIPAGLAACLLIIRTVLEDRTLLDELRGYKEYAKRTRYRLLPGVW